MLVKNLIATMAVAGAIGLTLVSDAQAGWGSSGGSWGSGGGSWGSRGSWGSSGGSWGSRGSSGGSGGSGGSSGASWGSRGSSGGSSGLFSRLHARVHCRPRVVYSSSGGSSGGGSSGYYGGGSSGAYAGGSSGNYYSGGSTGTVIHSTPVYNGGSTGTVISSGPVYSGGGSSGTVIHSGAVIDSGSYYGGGSVISGGPIMSSGTVITGSPIVTEGTIISNGGTVIDSYPSAPVDGSSSPTPPKTKKDPMEEEGTEGDDGMASSNDGLLAIDLPADAKVYVNGTETRTPGTHREYVSRGLERNTDYSYDIRAVVVRDGKSLEETRKVTVRAGKATRIAFDFQKSNPIAREKVETKLTVKVPQGAKVYLAGNATAATGETRVFRTKTLKTGETWDSYVVRVSHNVNGQTLTKEQTISLTGGDDRELSFDFNEASLADAR